MQFHIVVEICCFSRLDLVTHNDNRTYVQSQASKEIIFLWSPLIMVGIGKKHLSMWICSKL